MKASNVEWIVAAAAMFGSFNKLMDGLGIPLEPDTFAETVGTMDDAYTVNKAGSMLAGENEKHSSVPQRQSSTRGPHFFISRTRDYVLVEQQLYTKS
jgi:hypothetical protein